MSSPDPEAAELERYGAAIRDTAFLHPLEQVDALVALFGASAGDAPAFAAFLIGELVLTRMRLAASDPRPLFTLGAALP